MRVSRREFLAAAGATSVVGLAGCTNPLEYLGMVKPAGRFFASCTAPDGQLTDEFSHTLSRMTFGARPGDYDRVRVMGIESFLEQQLAYESIDDRVCDFTTRRLESITAPLGELFEYKEEFLREELTRNTVLRATYSERQLYEVMVEFWTDHFNISIFKGDCQWLKAADDRDVIRKHALGKFSDLVRASALSPAMLWYLDGRVNKKQDNDDRPNENYARELMELHTLGVKGGYTQQDVMEVARCLTGWTVRPGTAYFRGSVEFKNGQHDDGEKNVLGQTIPAGLGEGDLDRVLEIVTKHPSTARYVSWKLCRHFISESPEDETVSAVAKTFTDSGGDIKSILRTLFATPEFNESRATKFKRPTRFLVSALRATSAETTAEKPLLEYLMRMGQLPFQYPTPDGYPQEAAPWSGTLLWRWHFVAALAEDRIGGTKVTWDKLDKLYGSPESLMAHLLNRQPNESEARAASSSGFGPAVLMASPAFQRC
jgi:uncharacterized protein (DUF1800 family)